MHLEDLAATLAAEHPDALVVVLGDPADPAPVLAAVRAGLPSLAGRRGAVLLIGRASATLAQLARSLAAELGPRGVRANALAVGAADPDAALDAARFLLSDDAGYVTGALVPLSPTRIPPQG